MAKNTIIMNRFERLLHRLSLNKIEPNIFLGGAGAGGVGAEARLFGGLVAAQATMAAQKTELEFPIHSLHAYFLRPGRPERDIEFRVSHDKQGRNFAVRTVRAWQGEKQIFQLQASFQRTETGVHHQQPMPNAPPPQTCLIETSYAVVVIGRTCPSTFEWQRKLPQTARCHPNSKCG